MGDWNIQIVVRSVSFLSWKYKYNNIENNSNVYDDGGGGGGDAAADDNNEMMMTMRR